ncbi:unnamed protein product [Caenorhabditis angaria]|uniref:Major facilitator superfamily (MFS) profile domain-containing protein n=1 Tax=Caenorhabditis angaria TaxID=860376 RepID=A0A9P1J4P9_9PELO|nr:unnamed protein product [Caenorhabditis angaria]
MWFNLERKHLLALATWQFAIFFAGQNIFGIFATFIPPNSSRNCSNPEIFSNFSKHGEFFKSAAVEFDWICGNSKYYRDLFSQVHYSGVLVGTMVFGTLSDRYGRKPVGTVVLGLAAISTFYTAFVRSQEMLFSVRFFVGFASGGIPVVICTWVMELLLAEQRMVLRGIFNWGWTRIFLTTICYFIQNWRNALIVCALFTLPAIFLVIFVLPESPLWKSRDTRQDHSIWRQKNRGAAKHFWRRLTTLWCMWFVASICGFAVDLNSGRLSGNLYLNQILFGVILVASKLVLLAVDTRYPRFRLAAMTWIGYDGPIFLVISLLGTVFIEYTWDACYLCAIESMQTTLRSSATGTCSFWARIGAILAPFLNMATVYWPPAIYWAVILLGLVNLIISWRFLEETKNVDLAEVET